MNQPASAVASPFSTALKATPQALEKLIARLKESGHARTTGVKGGARGYLLGRLAAAGFGPIVAITPEEEQADALASDLGFFVGGMGTREQPRVLRLPFDELLPYESISPNRSLVQERLAALYHLRQGTPSLQAVVLSARGLSRKYPPAQRFDRLCELIGKEQTLDRDQFARRLVEMGYASAPVVEDVGTFSVRGGLVDVWSPTQSLPARLEFFGDLVESIRLFSPETQRTEGEVEQLDLCPARELLFSDDGRKRAREAVLEAADAANRPTSKTRELLEAIAQGIPAIGVDAVMPRFYEGGLVPFSAYLEGGKRQPLLFLDDPMSIQRALEELEEQLQSGFERARSAAEIALPPEEHQLAPQAAFEQLAHARRLESHALLLGEGGADEPIAFGFEPTTRLRDDIVSHHGEDGALSPLVDRLRGWRDAGIVAAVACGTAGQADKLKRLLLDRNTMVVSHGETFPAEEPRRLIDASIWAHLFPGDVSTGFVDRELRVAVLSDEDIFGVRQKRRARRKRVDQPFVEAFRDLREGDLVVHVDFGVGRYLGLVKKELAGVPGDFLLIEYAGSDKVYLPVSRLKQVQKFVGGDPATIKLDRLGGTAWVKTKARVKEELLKMAGELLKIQAARAAQPGHKFGEPDRYYRQFESDFEFETTPDQQKAIDDVLNDMVTGRPMDRLVCGDVGFGKTEVAIRATFKAVLDRKQVAILTPTTVLAAQHFQTFSRRFKDYPVRVEQVSRMRRADEVRDTLKKLSLGEIDVVIGTHRLLNKDVGFKDLGLVVVDEEQRFGVKHKEELKKLRSQVDVLTLTATPIPRTLHMAMSGLREMSIIATPPADRKSIRTVVQKYDGVVVQEAIRRELQRGGQVFFLHNRVDSMALKKEELAELVPEARVVIAHGQMKEGELEDVMTDFIERRYDVLLCSSIIESGLDIPNANTIIVDRADTFGLAQLYQIRGRVGRSTQRGYAYLLIPSHQGITDDAIRRLEVLQEHSELGAGFVIASHDLELRGAGNLLGGEQSGAIEAVGFDLYTQMLEEAVGEMSGAPVQTEIDPEVTLALPAFIPEDFVPDVHQRLVLYKRFAQVNSDDELSDLRAEVIDRFGEPPTEVDHLTAITELKLDLKKLRIRAMESGPARIVLTLGQDARLDPARMASFVTRAKGAYKLTPDMKLVAKVDPDAKDGALILEARRVVKEVNSCRSN